MVFPAGIKLDIINLGGLDWVEKSPFLIWEMRPECLRIVTQKIFQTIFARFVF